MRMNGEKELKLLLDIVKLNLSFTDCIQLLQAFDVLKWNNPSLIRSLLEQLNRD